MEGIKSRALIAFVAGAVVSYLAGSYFKDSKAAIFIAICFYGALIFAVLEKFVNAYIAKNQTPPSAPVDNRHEENQK